MNDCEEEEGGVVPFLTNAKYTERKLASLLAQNSCLLCWLASFVPGGVPFLIRAKYMLVYEYIHISTRRAQRTVIDVIVRGNWLPCSHKTADCCAG